MAKITVDGRDFEPARRTYRDLLAATDAEQEIADASDRRSALQVELEHAYNRLSALAEEEGEFDVEARDKIMAEVRAIRDRHREANADLLRANAAALAARMVDRDSGDHPEVDWLIDHMEEGQDREIQEALADVRPSKGSARTSGRS